MNTARWCSCRECTLIHETEDNSTIASDSAASNNVMLFWRRPYVQPHCAKRLAIMAPFLSVLGLASSLPRSHAVNHARYWIRTGFNRQTG
jgi:hypothetical protein